MVDMKPMIARILGRPELARKYTPEEIHLKLFGSESTYRFPIELLQPYVPEPSAEQRSGNGGSSSHPDDEP